jgi:sigma-B regulation protein RsbU (phosphoserine phosphatase)
MRASYQPCELAGGDYYDFTKLAGADHFDDPLQPWGIIMADVAGHGARAAVVMAILQTLTQSIPESRMDNPSDVLLGLNEQLLRKGIERTFVTAVCMSYDPRDRTVQVASAGHPAPRLKKPGEGSPVTAIPVEPCYPLGIDNAIKPATTKVQLAVEDTVVLFTDGITESFNRNRSMFGLSGLDKAIEGCSGEPDCIIDSIHRALAVHEFGRRPSDDQTILAFKVRAS